MQKVAFPNQTVILPIYIYKQFLYGHFRVSGWNTRVVRTHNTVASYEPTVITSETHVKAGTGRAALPQLFFSGFSWLAVVACAIHHVPEAWLHQVWSYSLRTPPASSTPTPPLPLISLPLTLTRCDLHADNGATAPPFLTPCQLTHFQRGITLFPHISLMASSSWTCSSPRWLLPHCMITIDRTTNR